MILSLYSCLSDTTHHSPSSLESIVLIDAIRKLIIHENFILLITKHRVLRTLDHKSMHTYQLLQMASHHSLSLILIMLP
jgi:hypothetical protein